MTLTPGPFTSFELVHVDISRYWDPPSLLTFGTLLRSTFPAPCHSCLASIRLILTDQTVISKYSLAESPLPMCCVSPASLVILDSRGQFLQVPLQSGLYHYKARYRGLLSLRMLLLNFSPSSLRSFISKADGYARQHIAVALISLIPASLVSCLLIIYAGCFKLEAVQYLS